MKIQKRIETYLLIITFLLAIISGLMLFDIAINPLLKSYFANQTQREEALQQSREVLKELSRLEFSIKGFYYLKSVLPLNIEELDEKTKYNYLFDYDDNGDTYNVKIRGNISLNTTKKLMEEFNLTGKLYSTDKGFLYIFTIKKVY
ncbi:hypothetical protein AT15_08695 [Kosmotoga arenicorallina S304]|uniref:Type II secretion system protein GspG C-terminal domain-containing protein n=1 Tax=Kosmotoga arenicorallina S304 TaxID=1453497 RepID=A0A176K1L6_9BACT|nr:hypothetical protein [Kosmotoga arenicorallina]OAA31042.1 hypothetical protein AT15_08695 [Kosmotoga arenicorallina S304]